MALTKGDLEQIGSLVEGSEKRIVGTLSLEFEQKLDQKLGQVRDEIVDGVTGVMSESLDMISDQITRLDGRMDKLDGRMDGLDGRMDKLGGRMDRLDMRMDRLRIVSD